MVSGQTKLVLPGHYQQAHGAGHKSVGFSTGFCSCTLKKTQSLSVSLFWFHTLALHSYKKRIFCEFFSVPGCPVEISSCVFEMRVPRSHLVNGILDLLPQPALSGCCWLHCSAVKSLNTLPPLQKKMRMESSSGGKGAPWSGGKFSFHIWEMLKVLFWWEWSQVEQSS